MKKLKILVILLAVGICFAQTTKQDSTTNKAKITFLELGSTTCVPCKMMEPVLENIREKYGEQIQVNFHDIKKQAELAEQYQIRMIPTQIFLNEAGKEIHRHIGFYPEEQIDEFLKEQGLKIIRQQ